MGLTTVTSGLATYRSMVRDLTADELRLAEARKLTTGIGAESYREIGRAAADWKVNADKVSVAYLNIETAISRTTDSGRQLAAVLNTMGVDVARGDAFRVMSEAADKLNGLRDGLAKTDLTRSIFGSADVDVLKAVADGMAQATAHQREMIQLETVLHQEVEKTAKKRKEIAEANRKAERVGVISFDGLSNLGAFTVDKAKGSFWNGISRGDLDDYRKKATEANEKAAAASGVVWARFWDRMTVWQDNSKGTFESITASARAALDLIGDSHFVSLGGDLNAKPAQDNRPAPLSAGDTAALTQYRDALDPISSRLEKHRDLVSLIGRGYQTHAVSLRDAAMLLAQQEEKMGGIVSLQFDLTSVAEGADRKRFNDAVAERDKLRRRQEELRAAQQKREEELSPADIASGTFASIRPQDERQINRDAEAVEALNKQIAELTDNLNAAKDAAAEFGRTGLSEARYQQFLGTLPETLRALRIEDDPIGEQIKQFDIQQGNLRRLAKDGGFTDQKTQKFIPVNGEKVTDLADSNAEGVQSNLLAQVDPSYRVDADHEHRLDMLRQLREATGELKIDEEEYQRLLGMEAEKYRRLSDPMSLYIEQLKEQAEAASATGYDRQDALTVSRLKKQAKRLGKDFDEDAATAALGDMRNAQMGVVIRQMDLATEHTLALAQAYRDGGQAVEDVDAKYKIEQQVLQTSEKYRAQITDSVYAEVEAKRALVAAQHDLNIAQEIADANRLADAWTGGATAIREANLSLRSLAQARQEKLDPNSEQDRLRIQQISTDQVALDVAKRREQFGQMAEEQRKSADLVNFEYGLLGKSNEERAKSVEIHRVTLDLQEKGADLTDTQTQGYIKQAGELAKQKAIISEQTAMAGDLSKTFATGLEDALLGKLRTGKDLIKAMGDDFAKIFVRQTITKPFETTLTAQLAKMNGGPLADTQPHAPAASSDSGLVGRLVASVTGGLKAPGSQRAGQSEDDALYVHVSGGSGVGTLPVNPVETKGYGFLSTDSLRELGRRTPSAADPALKVDNDDVVEAIKESAKQYGVPEEWALALARQESDFQQFNNNGGLNTSKAGAVGVMQLMPTTAKMLGVNSADTYENIDGGMRYYAQLGKQFSSWGLAAGAYNAGPGAMQGYLNDERSLPGETVNHMLKVSSFADGYVTSDAGGGGGIAKLEEEASGAADATQRLSESQSRYIDGVLSSLNDLPSSASKVAAANDVQAKASINAAQSMTSGVQQALGGIMTLIGGGTGNMGLSIGGATISAGGPAALQQAAGRLFNGVTGGTSGLSGLTDWLNKPMMGYPDAAPAQAAMYGGDFDTAQANQQSLMYGGDFDTAQVNQQPAGGGGPSWGQGLSGAANIAGGVLQASKGGTGNIISGGANAIAGVMAFTPLAWAAPIVSVVGSLIGGLVGNDKPDPYSVANLAVKNGRYSLGSHDADNGGDPNKYNSAVEQIATRLNTLVDKYGLTPGTTGATIGERNATPEEAMASVLRGLQSNSKDIAFVLAHATADNLNEITDQIDFASKLRATLVSLKDSADGTALAFQGGVDGANAFGKSILDIIKQSQRTFTADKIPGFATGTLSATPGLAVVGEEGPEAAKLRDGMALLGKAGPELVHLQGGERIWNARETAQMLASLGEGWDDTLIHLRSADELGAVQRALGTSGRVNPATGLLGFDGGTASGSGGENAGHGETSSSTAGRDSAYGGGWGGGGGGGSGALSNVAESLDSVSAAIADALASFAGWQAATPAATQDQTVAMASVAGLTMTAVAAGLSAIASEVGPSITGMIEGLTGLKSTNPAVDTSYDAMSARSDGVSSQDVDKTISLLADAIKADPSLSNALVGGLRVGGTETNSLIGPTVQDIVETQGSAFGVYNGDHRQVLQQMDDAAQQLLTATGTIPDVLRRALDVANEMAGSFGLSPVTTTRDRQDETDKLTTELTNHGLAGDRYADLQGVANSLQSGTFNPIGKNFQSLADDMTKAMDALTVSGKKVPDALYAAEKQMEVLAAAKTRLEDQVSGKRDASTDIQKRVAQIQGYWSEASATLVEAFKQVGVVGDDLRDQLAAGRTNALANARNDYLNGAPNAVGQNGATGTLNDLRGQSYLNTVSDINKQRRIDLADRAALGLDAAPADEAYRLRIRQMLVGMNQYQRDQVASSLGGDVAGVAAGLERGYNDYDQRSATARAAIAGTSSQELAFKRQAEDMARVTRQADDLNAAYGDTTRAIIRQTHALEDQAVAAQRADENLRTAMSRMSDLAGVAARGLSLQGKTGEANLLRFDISAQQQLYDARRNGGDVAGLSAVLAVERQQTEAESLRADYFTAIDRQTQAIQDNIDATTRNTGWLATVSENLHSASISARLSDSSPLSLEARLNEARRLFDETRTKFDDTALPKAERQRLAGLLQTYGQTEIDLAHQYFGSTNSSDFERVTSVWDNISGMTEEQIDSTRISLERQQEEIDELRRQRAEASKWGQAQVGSIDDLKIQTIAAFGRLSTGISGLSPASSTNSLFSSMLSAAGDRSSLDTLVQYAKDNGSVNMLTSAYKRANDLGLYYGNYSYAGPGAAVDNNWDAQATSAALGWLSDKGYSGGYDANANIYIQSHGLGDQFTNWISGYARTRGWMRHGGLVGAYADGGIVGNGTWDVDSVLARYAGGGSIALAGGEYVMPAHETAEYLGDLEAMRAGIYVAAPPDSGGWRQVAEQIARLAQQNATLQQQMLTATVAAAEANVEGHASTADALRTSKIMEMAA
jgi:hypothetical protein